MGGPLFEVSFIGDVVCLCSSTLEEGGNEVSGDEGCCTFLVSEDSQHVAGGRIESTSAFADAQRCGNRAQGGIWTFDLRDALAVV